MSEAKKLSIANVADLSEVDLATAIFIESYATTLGTIKQEDHHDRFAQKLAQRCIRSARILREELAKGEEKAKEK